MYLAFTFRDSQKIMMNNFPKLTMDSMKTWLKENLLLFLTFTGVLSGFVLGICLRTFDLSQEAILLIAYPGELFMRLLKLMILPLIIASLITGAASLNAKMNGMIALRTIAYFIITSLLSACVGLVLVIIIHPGNPEVKTLLGSGKKNTWYPGAIILPSYKELLRKRRLT